MFKELTFLVDARRCWLAPSHCHQSVTVRTHAPCPWITRAAAHFLSLSDYHSCCWNLPVRRHSVLVRLSECACVRIVCDHESVQRQQHHATCFLYDSSSFFVFLHFSFCLSLKVGSEYDENCCPGCVCYSNLRENQKAGAVREGMMTKITVRVMLMERKGGQLWKKNKRVFWSHVSNSWHSQIEW